MNEFRSLLIVEEMAFSLYGHTLNISNTEGPTGKLSWGRKAWNINILKILIENKM